MKIDKLTPKILSMMPKDERERLEGPKPATIVAVTDAFQEAEEYDLQEQIRGELIMRKITFDWSPMRRKRTGTIGWPDFVFPHPKTGQFVGIEAKSATGKQDEAQRDVEAGILSNWGRYHIVRTLEELRRILK